MKIETLKTSKRKYFWCALIAGVVLLITIVLTTSMAKYQITESIKIAEGSINYEPADFTLVALYIENEDGEYVETSSVPTDGYTLNSGSYCTIPGATEAITDTSVTMEYAYGALNFGNVTKKGTKCYLYFDVKQNDCKSSTCEVILASKTISTRDDFSVTMTADTTGTVYSAEDDDGTSYYFAGAPTDNYVYFAGFYWRIIRINGDGSIRLIYQGTSTTSTGATVQIGTSAFNSTYSDNMYVGYMYTSGQVHGLGDSSTIKGVLDSWYDNNLASYGKFIDTNAGFCGDRTPYTMDSGKTSGGGTGTTLTYYGAYIRLYKNGSTSNAAPSFKCPESSTDLYTVSSSSKGNKSLTNPIGLITADEISYAGGTHSTSNNSYYLYTGQHYWTLSPSYCNSASAYVFGVYSDGKLYDSYVFNGNGVRPVINLKSDTQFTGTGTVSNPYVVN